MSVRVDQGSSRHGVAGLSPPTKGNPTTTMLRCSPAVPWTHACTRARTHAHARTHARTRTQARTHVHKRTHAHAHTRARAHTRTHARTHAHTHVYTRAAEDRTAAPCTRLDTCRDACLDTGSLCMSVRMPTHRPHCRCQGPRCEVLVHGVSKS